MILPVRGYLSQLRVRISQSGNFLSHLTVIPAGILNKKVRQMTDLYGKLILILSTFEEETW